LNPPDPSPFAEPWEASAFALVVALHERGLFTWTEWAETLSPQLHAHPDSPYYASWLAALETLVTAKGVATSSEIAGTDAAWRRAAEATPHGQPIMLENDPEFGRTIP